MDAHWYKDAVLYELDVRSFYDGNGDGTGDFAGLTDKLDYLQQLGVTALVLGASRPSSLRDDGHDNAGDHSLYVGCGTLQDLERFLNQAHARSVRIVTELLVDRASDSAVNVDHPRMSRALLKVMRRWFDLGVDGLRLDGIPDLVEPEGAAGGKLPETHTIVKQMREAIDRDFPDRVLVAEANQSPEDVAPHLGTGDKCHMAFNCALMPCLLTALDHEDRRPVVELIRRLPEIPPSCQWALFLRNRDDLTFELFSDSGRPLRDQGERADQPMGVNDGICPRLAPTFDNDRRRIELAYGLLFSLPGSPVLYYGDEIGMGDNIYRGNRVSTPMQWSGARNGGFSSALSSRFHSPVNADPVFGYHAVNVEAQTRQPSSLFNWVRRLIAVRRQHAAFGRGTIEFLDPRNHAASAYIRRRGDERILVVANLSGKVQPVELLLSLYAGAQPVELLGGASFRRIGAGPYPLTLGPYGFYWFLLSRRAVRPTPSYEISAAVLGQRTDAAEAPAATAGAY